MNIFLDRRVLERIRAEYLEMLGMKLTIEQVQRLCGVEQVMCTLVLDALVRSNSLWVNADGTYARLTEGRISSARQAKAAPKGGCYSRAPASRKLTTAARTKTATRHFVRLARVFGR